MDSEGRAALRTLAGGIIILAVAIGISRFAYTPLLPLMQRDIGFGDDFAGLLASANYAGYLAGALWAAWTSKRSRRLARLRMHLALTIASTLGMGLTLHPGTWMALRFLSGATSALVFVLASGIVLEALADRRRASWSGWLYSGVGAGIALSAVLVPALGELGGWRYGWLGLGSVSMILALAAWRMVPGEPLNVRANAIKQSSVTPGSTDMLPWLTLAYGFEGLGYIVTGTFLVSWLQRSSDLSYVGFLAWLVVGLAAIPSCVLWMRTGLRLGLTRTLILAHLVQAVGILIPLFAPSVWGALAGGVFFGGTFLGITALTLVLGRTLAPERSDWVISILTAAFSAGQMLGPVIAGTLADHTRSFTLPLSGAAAIVALGALFLIIGLVRTRGAVARPVRTKP